MAKRVLLVTGALALGWIGVVLATPVGPDLCDRGLDQVSRDQWGVGLALYAEAESREITAAACNESHEPRWMHTRAGSCRGSWTWTVFDDERREVATWPTSGHYGECGMMRLIPPGMADKRTFHLDVEPHPGWSWHVRAMFYTQPYQIADGGGGSTLVAGGF